MRITIKLNRLTLKRTSWYRLPYVCNIWLCYLIVPHCSYYCHLPYFLSICSSASFLTAILLQRPYKTSLSLSPSCLSRFGFLNLQHLTNKIVCDLLYLALLRVVTFSAKLSFPVTYWKNPIFYTLVLSAIPLYWKEIPYLSSSVFRPYSSEEKSPLQCCSRHLYWVSRNCIFEL